MFMASYLIDVIVVFIFQLNKKQDIAYAYDIQKVMVLNIDRCSTLVGYMYNLLEEFKNGYIYIYWCVCIHNKHARKTKYKVLSITMFPKNLKC